MLYFTMNTKAELIHVSTERNAESGIQITRHDFKCFSDAEAMAAAATKLTGRLHIAIDNGKNHWPQFDAAEAPKVGDKVSQSFNGDSYPRGTIVKISPTLKKITTDTGHVFYRLRNTGSWLINGYASMIPGHVSEMNPSF